MISPQCGNRPDCALGGRCTGAVARHDQALLRPLCQDASVNESAGHRFAWREHTYPSGRWRRLFARTVAHADVVAPNGRANVVRVTRLLWPPAGRQNVAGGWPVEEVEAIPAVLATRVVWGVRVARYPRPLIGLCARSAAHPCARRHEVQGGGLSLRVGSHPSSRIRPGPSRPLSCSTQMVTRRPPACSSAQVSTSATSTLLSRHSSETHPAIGRSDWRCQK